jgi:hypothetical protein
MAENVAAVRSEVEHLTAQASNLFSSGRIEEAACCWRDALGHLIPRILAEKERNSERAVHLHGSFASQPLELSPWSPACLASGDRIFSVYPSAIDYFPGQPRGEDLATAEEPTTELSEQYGTIAACLYNLGLSHHLFALTGGRGGSGRLGAGIEKAQRYYNAAQNVLKKAGATFLPADGAAEAAPTGARLFGLALLNNQGCLYDRQYHLAASLRALDVLHSLLLPVTSSMFQVSDVAVAGIGAFLPFVLTAVLYPAGGANLSVFIHAPCA